MLATDWLQYEEIEDAEERDKKAVANPQTGGEEKDEKMEEDNQLRLTIVIRYILIFIFLNGVMNNKMIS